MSLARQPHVVRRFARYTIPVTALTLLFSLRADAGTPDEFWPEVDVWYAISKATQALFTAAATRSNDDGDRAASEVALYIDHRATEHISLRAGFLETIDRQKIADEHGSGEHRLSFDFNYRWPLDERTQVSDRTRLDLRNLGEDESVRIRNRLRIEREIQLQRLSLTPYATVEAYYDTRFHAVSRWRLESGCTMPTGRHLEWDFYFGWQHDSQPESKFVDGVGITLNVKL